MLPIQQNLANVRSYMCLHGKPTIQHFNTTLAYLVPTFLILLIAYQLSLHLNYLNFPTIQNVSDK